MCPQLTGIGPLHDPVTWYKINNAPAFVLEVPLRNLLTSIFNFVLCDRLVKRAYWVPFAAWTFEKGYKFTDVDAEKIVPTQECKIPNAKPEGKPYPVSDQNGEILCAFSDQNSSKTIYPLVPHIPISGSTPLDYEWSVFRLLRQARREKKDPRKKMAARDPGEKCFSPPGFHAAVFFRGFLSRHARRTKRKRDYS